MSPSCDFQTTAAAAVVIHNDGAVVIASYKTSASVSNYYSIITL